MAKPVEQSLAHPVGRGAQARALGHGQAGALPGTADDADLARAFGRDGAGKLDRVDAGGHAFCCGGCAAAAAWIEEADLGSYYRLRSANANRVQADRLDLDSWDRSELLDQHSRVVDGGREIVLLTDGMRCAACAWLIDRALSREPGVTDISANAVTGRIRIAWDPARTPLSRPLRRAKMLPMASMRMLQPASRAQRTNRSRP